MVCAYILKKIIYLRSKICVKPDVFTFDLTLWYIFSSKVKIICYDNFLMLCSIINQLLVITTYWYMIFLMSQYIAYILPCTSISMNDVTLLYQLIVPRVYSINWISLVSFLKHKRCQQWQKQELNQFLKYLREKC